MKLARSGHKNVFSSLIERYQPMARHLALSMVNNENIAKELVQEAMLQAYLSLGHLNHDERFKSWFYGIVLNVCRSYLRDQKIDFFSWEALMGGVWDPPPHLTRIQPGIQEIIEEKAGIDVSTEMARSPRLGQGLEAIVKEMETRIAPSQKAVEELAPEPSEEQKRKEKIKALLFGSSV